MVCCLQMDARTAQAGAQAKADCAARHELEGCRLVRCKLQHEMSAMQAQLAAHKLLPASTVSLM
jgi:hypothetical protein